MPRDSRRWSLNIGPSSNAKDTGSGEGATASAGSGTRKDVLFHFNPRRGKRSHQFQLVMNNLVAMQWGQVEAIVIDEDLLFGRTFELIIQASRRALMMQFLDNCMTSDTARWLLCGC